MAELTLHEHEQRAILASPRSIMLLMYWHDYQQTCADASDMGCHGNARRYEELKAHGRAIIEKEGADAFDEEVLRAFDLWPAPGVPGTFLCRKPAIGPACETQCERCAAEERERNAGVGGTDAS